MKGYGDEENCALVCFYGNHSFVCASRSGPGSVQDRGLWRPHHPDGQRLPGYGSTIFSSDKWDPPVLGGRARRHSHWSGQQGPLGPGHRLQLWQLREQNRKPYQWLIVCVYTAGPPDILECALVSGRSERRKSFSLPDRRRRRGSKYTVPDGDKRSAESFPHAAPQSFPAGDRPASQR